MQRPVSTTYLEMTDRAQLRPARPASVDFQLLRAEVPCPEFSRFLYTAVGADWWWYTRLSWDYAQWLAYLDRPELETWVAYAGGTPAGYFELERQDADNVEIAYFGILPSAFREGTRRRPSRRSDLAGVGHRSRAGLGPHLHTRPSAGAPELPGSWVHGIPDGGED